MAPTTPRSSSTTTRFRGAPILLAAATSAVAARAKRRCGHCTGSAPLCDRHRATATSSRQLLPERRAADRARPARGRIARGVAATGEQFVVDLEALTIRTPSGGSVRFTVDATRRRQLLAGLDDLGSTLLRLDDVARFQEADRGSARGCTTSPSQEDIRDLRCLGRRRSDPRSPRPSRDRQRRPSHRVPAARPRLPRRRGRGRVWRSGSTGWCKSPRCPASGARPGAATHSSASTPPASGGFPRATRSTARRSCFPELTYRRLDELGIDFAVLYPTYGLPVTAIPNNELRCASPSLQPLLRGGLRRFPRPARTGGRDPDLHARGGDRRARPRGRGARAQGRHARRARSRGPTMAEPRRAVAGSTRWATTRSRLRPASGGAARSSASRRRSTPAGRDGAPGCPRRTTRTTRSATSPAAARATCRSLVFGGVPRRFPNLRFAFQEGGVAWAPRCSRAVATGRSAGSRRSSTTTRRHLDRDALGGLFDEYATGAIAAASRPTRRSPLMLSDPDELAARRRPVRASRCSPVSTTSSTSFTTASSSAARPTIRSTPRRSRRPESRRRHAAGRSSAPTLATGTCRDMREVLVRGLRAGRRRARRRSAFPDFVFENPVRLWPAPTPTSSTAPSWSRPWRRRSR